MKILTLTSLYPNACQPRHGIFIETRVRKLKERYPDLEVEVLAPVPWFPLLDRFIASRKALKNVPATEVRHGIQLYHPRYLAIPGLGMYTNPFFMFIALCWFHWRKPDLIKGADVLDAHYIYPDGVAAAWLAKLLKKPLMLTARGNDISLLPSSPVIRPLIVSALQRADVCAGVCQALVNEMRELAPQQPNYAVLRNGVDLALFRPLSAQDRQQLRQQRGLDQQYVLLCVGHFIERKGQYLIVEAMAALSGVTLLLAGDGEMQGELMQQVERLGLSSRVKFLGHRSPEQLNVDYNCADLLLLPSSREGWANVLLESMACGTRVLATNVWGTPEVVAEQAAGTLLQERSVAALTEAIETEMNQKADRSATRRYAELFSWEETVSSIHSIAQKLSQKNAR